MAGPEASALTDNPEHNHRGTCEQLARSTRLRWLIGGIAFGAMFPAIGWLFAGGHTLSGIAEGHRTQPVLYIVDLAPIVLGATGYGIGVFHSRLIRIRHSIEDVVRARTAELQQALTDLSNTQAELLSAQKLEAIGGLAAGIAHEINTPIQYVSDNTRFIEESVSGLLDVASAATSLVETVQDIGQAAGHVEKFQQAAEDADIEFLTDEVPQALADSLIGLEQVARIVRALKSFAHPGSEDKAPGDLNDIIATTAAVSRNEWKYVAELELDGLDPNLPHVPVLAGPLKQVILNTVVNAAHAIETVQEQTGEMGTIRITTRVDGEVAEIAIADTGAGIPEEVRDRIFEPFFTTKGVGKGSGQGLPIAKSIVEKHGGTFTFESEIGKGTTFFIRLPLADDQAAPDESAEAA
ncbi:MAG: HAMP domain-containing sensor histidine kinase [Acidimicrobiia bacterium]|nr:HAMP domain-containing sensor histidine kinase [Acidimicrobiia bacterium]